MEIELCRQLDEHDECIALGLSASLATHGGAIVLLEGRPLGYWVVVGDRLRCRDLTGGEIFSGVLDVEDALLTTVALAKNNRGRCPLRGQYRSPCARRQSRLS